MKKTSAIIRIILELILMYLIYRETGISTAIFCSTITIWIHLNDSAMKSIIVFMSEVKTGKYGTYVDIINRLRDLKGSKLADKDSINRRTAIAISTIIRDNESLSDDIVECLSNAKDMIELIDNSKSKSNE